MRRLGVLLFLLGCGGQIDRPTFEMASAANLEAHANQLAEQQSALATLTEIQGKGISRDGTLTTTGSWSYRYTSPQGAFEITLSGDGRIKQQKLRGTYLGRIYHYSIDSPEALRRMPAKQFPTKVSLVASGSYPYWVIEGRPLRAVD